MNKKENSRDVFYVPANKFILDGAEENDVDMPYQCRAGNCAVCLGKLVDGVVDQKHNSYLTEKQLEAGYVMTCFAYPVSDCTIEVEIDNNQFYSLFD